jgi:hypothetical protein
MLLLVESVQVLLDGLAASSDVQGELSDFPHYARHVRGTPRKCVSVCTEKVNEHYFLFGVKVGADPQHLAFRGLWVEEDELGLLHRLEALGVALGVRDVLSETVKVGDQGCYLDYGFSLLHTVDVALLGMLAHRADGDDAVGAWHLELEVGVVGDDHELGITWSPEDHVIGSREPYHVEGEDFPPEVVGSPKTNGQVDLPEWVGSMPRHHSMEW